MHDEPHKTKIYNTVHNININKYFKNLTTQMKLRDLFIKKDKLD